MTDFETSKKKIEELVNAFAENESNFKSESFDEANTRNQFIDEFFIALGWDVRNKRHKAPQYADVELEDKIKVKGKTKSPDYCFRYWGERKFFVEAKAPHEDIENNREHAFQFAFHVWGATNSSGSA